MHRIIIVMTCTVLFLAISLGAMEVNPDDANRWLFDIQQDDIVLQFYADRVGTDSIVVWMMQSDIQKALLEAKNADSRRGCVSDEEDVLLVDPDDPFIRFSFEIISSCEETKKMDLLIDVGLYELYSEIAECIRLYQEEYSQIHVALRRMNDDGIDVESHVYDLRKGVARMSAVDYIDFVKEHSFYLNVYFRKFVSMEIDGVAYPSMPVNVRSRSAGVESEGVSMRLFVYYDHNWMMYR